MMNKTIEVVGWEMAPGVANLVYGSHYGKDWIYRHERLGYLTSIPEPDLLPEHIDALNFSQNKISLIDTTVRMTADLKLVYGEYGQWIYHDDEVGYLLSLPFDDLDEALNYLQEKEEKQQ